MTHAVPRWAWRAAAFWLVVAFVVFNGFFDVFVSRGEKQYLLGQARHELGIAPAASMDAVMTRTIRDGAGKAAIWAGIVFAAGMGATAHARRGARRERLD